MVNEKPGAITESAAPIPAWETRVTSIGSATAAQPVAETIRRPRVLLVPNAASWIIGQMAEQITKRFSDRFEFWLLTDKMIRLRPDLVRALAPAMDFMFPLTDKGAHLLRQAMKPFTLPSLLWIHHVSNWGPTMREAVETSDEVIVCTPEWGNEVGGRCRVETAVTVVPHGVDLASFRRLPRQRRRLGMPEDAFVAGFVGSKTSNLDEGRKGVDILMAALHSLRERVPRLHVAFLGLGWETEVRRLRAENISAHYVGFLPQARLAEFYSSIDAYVMTSRIEGGPCTVLEAMACETPVVATRVGLVPRTIEDGRNGFSTPIDDFEMIADRLGRIAESADLARSIGAAARKTVDPDVAWSHVLDRLEAPLTRMAARSRRLSSDIPVSQASASRLRGGVHAADGLLWAAASFCQRMVSARVACLMVKACLAESRVTDVLRGIGLVTRLSFRPYRRVATAAERSKDRVKAAPHGPCVFYNHTSQISGAERMLLLTLGHLPEHAKDAALICPADGPLRARAEAMGIKWYPAPALNARFTRNPLETIGYAISAAAAIRGLRRMLIDLSPDLVHANSVRAGMVATISTLGSGVPVIWHVHDILPRHPVTTLVRFIARRCGRVHVLGCSQAAARSVLQGDSTGQPERLTVIHNGIDVERFSSAGGDRQATRRSFGFDDDSFIVGIVGQITPRKGHLTLLKAFALLRLSVPHARLVVAGAPLFNRDHKYLDTLRREAERRDLDNYVRFAGPREDVPAVMRALDLLVLSSELEPFGLVLPEAMIMGTPVLATRSGGPEEIIEHGVNGHLAPVGDVTALAEALVELAANPALRAAYSEQGPMSVKNRFSSETYMQKLCELHSRLQGAHHRRAEQSDPALIGMDGEAY